MDVTHVCVIIRKSHMIFFSFAWFGHFAVMRQNEMSILSAMVHSLRKKNWRSEMFHRIFVQFSFWRSAFLVPFLVFSWWAQFVSGFVGDCVCMWFFVFVWARRCCSFVVVCPFFSVSLALSLSLCVCEHAAECDKKRKTNCYILDFCHRRSSKQ